MLCDIPSKHWSKIAFTFVTADLLYITYIADNLKIPSQWLEFFSTLTLSGYSKLESVHMRAFLIRKGGYIILLSYPFCLQLPCLLISRSFCCRSTQEVDAALWFWVELISSKGLLKLNWLRSSFLTINWVIRSQVTGFVESSLQGSLDIRAKNWSKITFTFVRLVGGYLLYIYHIA